MNARRGSRVVHILNAAMSNVVNGNQNDTNVLVCITNLLRVHPTGEEQNQCRDTHK